MVEAPIAFGLPGSVQWTNSSLRVTVIIAEAAADQRHRSTVQQAGDRRMRLVFDLDPCFPDAD